LVIANPLLRLGDEAIAPMIRASADPAAAGSWISTVPFEIYTPENIERAGTPYKFCDFTSRA
jgi:hypothetical protein